MTAFVLKIIALTCMVIDHIGAVFPDYFPFALRIIGRIAFPIYVYLIADGCRHTRSMPKYMLRLGIFALVSQIPFDLAINQGDYGPLNIDFLHDTNVFYTLFLGVLSIFILQKLKETGYKWAIIAAFPALLAIMALAEYLGTDYGGYGVAFIFLMYFIPQKTPRLAVMAVCCCYEFYPVVLSLFENGANSFYLYSNGWIMLASCLLSVPLVAIYNGRRGPSLKWFFYAVYPAHLLLLAVIWLVWFRPGFIM